MGWSASRVLRPCGDAAVADGATRGRAVWDIGKLLGTDRWSQIAGAGRHETWRVAGRSTTQNDA